MSVKKRAFEAAFGVAESVLRLQRASALSCALAERLHPVAVKTVDGKPLHFSVPNSLVRWRVDTLLEKEPETIEWIDSFAPGAVFYDVGANIGLYSLYAASRRGCRVLAFEPESGNYALLNQNILLNGLQTRVLAYNLGVSDEDALSVLHLSGTSVGLALHNVGAAVDFNDKPFGAAHEQGIMTVSLDSFIERYKPAFPEHVKIDVDGLEPRIVRGMKKILADPRFQSISVELNDERPDHMTLLPEIEGAGLAFVHKRHAAMFDASPFHSCFNYLFRRGA